MTTVRKSLCLRLSMFLLRLLTIDCDDFHMPELSLKSIHLLKNATKKSLNTSTAIPWKRLNANSSLQFKVRTMKRLLHVISLAFSFSVTVLFPLLTSRSWRLDSHPFNRTAALKKQPRIGRFK